MRHFMMVYVFRYDKNDFQEKNVIFFGIYKLWPREIYNGPSQVYYIEQEGWIH